MIDDVLRKGVGEVFIVFLYLKLVNGVFYEFCEKILEEEKKYGWYLW